MVNGDQTACFLSALLPCEGNDTTTSMMFKWTETTIVVRLTEMAMVPHL